MPSGSSETSPQDSSSLLPFSPKPGDIVLARWVGDGVFYRARLLRAEDSVYSLLDFIGYGTGFSRSDDLYADLAHLPHDCFLDQYLYREEAYALRMKQRLESAARMERELASSS